ncbi:hypothetical protein D3C73_690250 [compost metagenome]
MFSVKSRELPVLDTISALADVVDRTRKSKRAERWRGKALEIMDLRCDGNLFSRCSCSEKKLILDLRLALQVI